MYPIAEDPSFSTALVPASSSNNMSSQNVSNPFFMYNMNNSSNSSINNYNNNNKDDHDDDDKNTNEMFFYTLTMAIYLLNSCYTSNHIYNTMDNYNFCHYHNMTFKNEMISRWLKWINNLYIDYETKEDDSFGSFSHSQLFKQLKKDTKMIENVFYANLNDFYNFDDYTNINRTLLSSFLYYLNRNNIYNTYMLLNHQYE